MTVKPNFNPYGYQNEQELFTSMNEEVIQENDYRKIYEHHYGPIPKDEKGRVYEIHHIDGDRSNNCIENLKCVSIQEHYDIHYTQKDWGACYFIKTRMSNSPEELSEILRQFQLNYVKEGIHPFLKSNRNKYPLIIANEEKFRNKNINDNPAKHPEAKEKISKKLKEWHQINDNPMLGKNHSDKSKLLMSINSKAEKNGMYGKRVSEKTKLKMSLARKAYWDRIKAYGN